MVRKSYPNIITYCNSFMLITVTNTDKLDQVHPMSLTMLWTRYDVNSQSMLFILKCVENVLSFKSIKGQMELYDTHMKKCILLPAVFAFQSTKRWTAKHTSTQTSACAGAWRWLQLVWFLKQVFIKLWVPENLSMNAQGFLVFSWGNKGKTFR